MSKKTLGDHKKTDFGYLLNDEEAELLRAIDEGHFMPVENLQARKKELQELAREFMRKNRESSPV